MLRGSRHLGQIRVILLGEEVLTIMEAEKLWMETGKPVIMAVNTLPFDPRHMFRYMDKVFSASGIDEESAKRVMDVIYGDRGSEAIRIGDIILKALVNLHNV